MSPPPRRRSLSRLLPLALGALALPACRDGQAHPARAEPGDPVVRDERLALSLFAAAPDIVTPIGIAVDARDRLYVLESHTHTPPPGYAGPRGDRVKLFEDADGDGRPERVAVFAEGLEDGMNLAFSPDGVLHAVTSRAVWALHDRDGDGVSEARTRLVHLAEPGQVYDHAALLGITFAPDGWMYLSRGNTGGQAWRMVGSDGSSVQGYGDGGNVVRARLDGSRLEEVATGFWNPFDLKLDAHGRLLAADNDPDSRGPNRLVHVVEGGDYGYRSLYGGSGIHPYLAWNGELPGTLPYAAPLGEAPSGLLDATLAALPADYQGEMLATVWEESRVVRVRLTPRGASLAGEVLPLVEGGPLFHPVALAADSRGTVYLTDWMVRRYPNHGQGRIWRLKARPGVRTVPPRAAFAPPRPDAGRRALDDLYSATAPADFPRLRAALASDDPFVRTAAVTALAAEPFRRQLLDATADPDARVRLGALLALRRAGLPAPEPIVRALLADPDAQVRRMALVWAGSAGLLALRPDLERAISSGAPDATLFEAYLATVQQLTPEFVAAFRGRAERYAKDLERELPPRFLERFVADPARPAALRAVALTHLPDPAAQAGLLARLARSPGAPALRLEAVRSLGFAPGDTAAAALRAVARDRASPAALRAEAMLALARHPGDASATATALLADPDADVRLEAERYLRGRREPAPEPGRPATMEGWQAALASGGDPERGRRVFFSPRALCSQCHAAERRGGELGPDLSNIGRSKTRAQLVHSIVRPSDEITPEWQGWYVRTKDGQTHYGRQIDVGDDGADLYVLPGHFVTLKNVQEYGVVDRSLMPEGLESRLTVDELRDLLAFLERGR